MTDTDRENAIVGTLLGTALGDALGLPCEGMRPEAIDDINIIRSAHGLADFTDPGNDAAVLDEILYNKFMSLTLEGGYTYFDARQYGRTDQLPRARADHVVFPQLPFPQNECLARDNLGTGTDEPCGTIFGS